MHLMTMYILNGHSVLFHCYFICLILLIWTLSVAIHVFGEWHLGDSRSVLTGYEAAAQRHLQCGPLRASLVFLLLHNHSLLKKKKKNGHRECKTQLKKVWCFRSFKRTDCLPNRFVYIESSPPSLQAHAAPAAAAPLQIQASQNVKLACLLHLQHLPVSPTAPAPALESDCSTLLIVASTFYTLISPSLFVLGFFVCACVSNICSTAVLQLVFNHDGSSGVKS